MSENAEHRFRFGDKLSIGSVDALVSEFDQYLKTASITYITLDLSNVLVCDSYGVTLLLQFYRKAQNKKKKIVLYGPRPFLIEILKNCGLLKVFTLINAHKEKNDTEDPS